MIVGERWKPAEEKRLDRNVIQSRTARGSSPCPLLPPGSGHREGHLGSVGRSTAVLRRVLSFPKLREIKRLGGQVSFSFVTGDCDTCSLRGIIGKRVSALTAPVLAPSPGYLPQCLVTHRFPLETAMCSRRGPRACRAGPGRWGTERREGAPEPAVFISSVRQGEGRGSP